MTQVHPRDAAASADAQSVALSRSAASPWSADERLRLLVDGTLDYAIVMLGPQGMVLTWSRGAEQILGHTTGEIIGQDCSVFYRDETRSVDSARDSLARAADENRFEEQGWLVRKDGTRFWANIILTALRDRAGRLRGYSLVARDLTERVRSLELLAVLHAASDAILGVDANGRVMFLNTAAEDVFRYSRAELLGRPVELLLPAKARAAHPGHRARYSQDPHRRPMGGGLDLTAVRKDGSEFPAEVSLSSVSTPWGRITTATVRDLTEQLRAQQELALSQERIRVAFEHSAVGQAEATLEARILRANHRLETMLGYRAGQLVGTSWPELVDPRDRATLVAEISALPAAGTETYQARCRLLRRDGTVLPTMVAASIMRDRDGKPLGIAGVVVDLTVGDEPEAG